MANQYPAIITAFFADKNGAPALNLTPSICIYQMTSVIGSPQGDTLVIGTAGGSPIVPMTEVGKGFYKYVFSGYNSQLKYAYQIDGEAGGTGVKLGLGRYVVGTNENFAEDVAYEVWDEPQSLHPVGSPSTMASILKQIFNTTVGSPTGSGSSFTLNQIIAGVWGETLMGSPLPYPPGSAGNLLAYNNQILEEILETNQDLGGSPRINLATTIWNTIVIGSPQPFPPGSAGNTVSLTNETVNNIETNTLSLLEYSEALLAAQYNRTFLDKTAFTLTIYGSDNVTPIRVFSLRDSTGTPSITEIVDRLPVGGSPLLPVP